MVVELSNRIRRRQPLDAPLFGHNVLVASHDEDLGVSHHCQRCIHAADTLTGNVKESVADSEHPCQTQRSDRRNQKNARSFASEPIVKIRQSHGTIRKRMLDNRHNLSPHQRHAARVMHLHHHRHTTRSVRQPADLTADLTALDRTHRKGADLFHQKPQTRRSSPKRSL